MNQKQLNLLHHPNVQLIIKALQAEPTTTPETQQIKTAISNRVQAWITEFEKPKIKRIPHLFDTPETINTYITQMRSLHGPNWCPF